MHAKHKKIIELIKNLGRLLTEQEIIQFYLDNTQRKTCYVSFMYAMGDGKTFQDKHEYKFEQIRTLANNSYHTAIGRAVREGALVVSLDGKTKED